MEERLRGQTAASAAAGDESEAMEWKGRLAAMLSLQGRHADAVVLFEAGLKYWRRVLGGQDALAMKEKTLEFLRRRLPENHPEIGAT